MTKKGRLTTSKIMINKNNILLTSLLFTLAILLLPSVILAAAPPSIGEISPPPGTSQQTQSALTNNYIANANEIAIFFFISNIIKIATAAAGVYVIYNLAIAGYDFLTAGGKADAYQKARDRLVMSAIGLLLIVLAYLITALLSLLIFGDAGFILNPTLSNSLF